MADPPVELLPNSCVVVRSESAALRCCCGRLDCVFLKHNCFVLESVEKDVHVAAKMGQALLARHEAYMASAERDRADLNARIEQLELDKAALQETNMRTVEENRSLLDQLEQLNGTVTDSEIKIRNLEATLTSTQLTIKMLESATARAAEMERQIATLEEEQEALQKSLADSEEEARSALYRWKKAERGINNLQEQLERMEREAREERERHVEVIGRMEKQRAMERDLDTAAGRLKGAAAAKSLNDSRNRTTVVSHFVRDLLQDNANLQLSIAELRELLMNSNDEIQVLRDQLLCHQPIEGEGSTASTLRAELEPREATQLQRVSQELHIHHHYHVVSKPEPKKIKKRRQGLAPGIFTPPVGIPSSPTTPPTAHWQTDRSSPGPALLSRSAKESTSTTFMSPNRWSVFSDQRSELASSSVPSSPLSNPRHSMFDHGVVDVPLPTSPTSSVDPASPSWRAFHKKHQSEMSTRTISMPFTLPLQENAACGMGKRPKSPATTPYHPSSLNPVQEDPPFPSAHASYTVDEVPELAITSTTADDSTVTTPSEETDAEQPDDVSFASVTSPEPDHFDPVFTQPPRSSVRRVVSHESIMSLSNGMDIHTLKARPSQLALRPLGAAAPGTGVSAVTARPTISRGDPDGKRGSVVLRNNLSCLPLQRRACETGSGRAVSGPARGRNTSPSSMGMGAGALGRLVSWRLWGSSDSATPAAANAGSSSSSLLSKSSSTREREKEGGGEKDLSRAPGINQPGAVPIPGFYEYWAAHQRKGAPSKVCPDVVDREALKEVLEGG